MRQAEFSSFRIVRQFTSGTVVCPSTRLPLIIMIEVNLKGHKKRMQDSLAMYLSAFCLTVRLQKLNILELRLSTEIRKYKN